MNSKRICMLGICGAGMAPLAIYLSQRGHTVYGWDDNINFEVKDLLIANKIVFIPEKQLPENCDYVVRSSAINEQNDSICQAALQQNIQIVRRGDFLAKICEDKKLIAVIGSHGKTSVSANCVEILQHNKIVFDYIIGGFFKKNIIAPAHYDAEAEYIVAEIDESDRTIESFSPEFTIALNYDDDHVSNYGQREVFIQTFEDFFARTKQKIFVPETDEVFSNLASKFKEKYVKMQKLDSENFTKKNQEISLFCLESIFHKKLNAPEDMVGVKRRNDIMFNSDNITILNDYAHHPTEINALLQYTRAQYPNHELNIVFQPHRLSRTKQYFREFAYILSKFDRPYVVELYAAFEEPIEGVSSLSVFDNIENKNKDYLELANFSVKIREIFDTIKLSGKKQLLMFVGAGSILHYSQRFVTEIAFAAAANKLSANRISFSTQKKLTNAFSIRVESMAAMYVEPSSVRELTDTINICKEYNLRYVIIGNGTKILPPDKVINAVVIGMKSDCWKETKWLNDNTLYCSCGVNLEMLCKIAEEKKFSGVEKLMFIPCCVGGAVMMNAGSHGQSISDYLIDITIMDPMGNVKKITKEEIKFEYRKTSIPRDHIVLGATFLFNELENEEYFKLTREQLLDWRIARQPQGPTFGSVFKNGDDFSAGELIDKAGLKGHQIGGARISTKHANFIINENCATAADVEKLMDLARYTVFNKFQKYLNAEINILRA